MSAALARAATAQPLESNRVRSASAELSAARSALADAITQRDINQAELHNAREALESGKADRVAASRARVLCETVPAAPSSSEIEDLQSDVQGRESAAPVFAARVDARKADVDRAEQTLNAAVRSTITEGFQAQALADWDAAVEALRDAGVRLMACDRVKREFGAAVRAYELDGKAAAALTAMRGAEWPEEMRPSWAPRNGTWRATDMAGVNDVAAQIRADIAAELAA